MRQRGGWVPYPGYVATDPKGWGSDKRIDTETYHPYILHSNCQKASLFAMSISHLIHPLYHLRSTIREEGRESSFLFCPASALGLSNVRAATGGCLTPNCRAISKNLCGRFEFVWEPQPCVRRTNEKKKTPRKKLEALHITPKDHRVLVTRPCLETLEAQP